MTPEEFEGYFVQKYDRIRVTTKQTAPHAFIGTFRARIVSVDNANFDRAGSAIWVTDIFEHFIALEDIVELDVFMHWNDQPGEE